MEGTQTPEFNAQPTFNRKLRELLNSCSKENGSNTPDFLLTQYLLNCLENFDEITKARDMWHGMDSRKTFNPK